MCNCCPARQLCLQENHTDGRCTSLAPLPRYLIAAPTCTKIALQTAAGLSALTRLFLESGRHAHPWPRFSELAVLRSASIEDLHVEIGQVLQRLALSAGLKLDSHHQLE